MSDVEPSILKFPRRIPILNKHRRIIEKCGMVLCAVPGDKPIYEWILKANVPPRDWSAAREFNTLGAFDGDD